MMMMVTTATTQRHRDIHRSHIWLSKMTKVPAVVIGGGVCGIACARALAMNGIHVVLLEKNNRLGLETSSRSSEVIHAGLYYKHKSLKSKFCIEGRALLYQYLESRCVPFRRCGKLVVCNTVTQIDQLMRLNDVARRNGVDLDILSSADVKFLEPDVICVKALFSQNTGVFDSHEYLQCLQQDAESHGATFVMNCTVEADKFSHAIVSDSEGFRISTSHGEVTTNLLVNAGGLWSPFIAKSISNYPTHRVPSAYFAKGTYFKLQGTRAPFTHLVYPLPSNGGLGIHSTIDVSGNVKFGPDVEWLRESSSTPPHSSSHGDANVSVAAVDEGVNEDKDDESDERYRFTVGPPSREVFVPEEGLKSKFVTSIRNYWPDVCEENLVADYCGVRPKLVGPSSSSPSLNSKGVDVWGRDLSDFVVEGPDDHGVPGLVNLFGIESPGLTSSLAIAEHVKRLLVR